MKNKEDLTKLPKKYALLFSVVCLALSFMLFSSPTEAATYHVNITSASGLIKDDGFDNDSDSDLNDALLDVVETRNTGYSGGDGFAVARFQYDLSQLPANASIISTKFSWGYMSGDANVRVRYWGSNNVTWVEGSLDDLFGANQPITSAAQYPTVFNNFDEYLGSWLIGFGDAFTVNNTNLTSWVNYSFHNNNENVTIMMNLSSDGTKDLQTASAEYAGDGKYKPYLQIVYDEMPAPAGGSPGSYEYFDYGEYLFKIDLTTSELINVSYHGEDSVLARYSRNYFYDNTTMYNISNVTLSYHVNTTGYDNIQVNSTLEYGGQSYALVIENWHFLNMSRRFYLADQTVYAKYQDTPLWKYNATFKANDATSAYYDTSAGSPTKLALTNTGNVVQNYTIITGTGSNTQNTRNYIRGINSSNGFFYIATANRCSNMENAGQNECSYAWAHADDLDPSETYNELHHDYNITTSNKTMYVRDLGSNSYLYFEISFNGLTGFSKGHEYTYILRKQGDIQELRTVAQDHFRNHFVFGIGSPTESISAAMTTFESESTYLSGEVSFLGNRITDGMRNIQTGAISGAQYGDNPTNPILTVDHDIYEDVAKENLLANAYRATDWIDYGYGWFLYPPWPASSYGQAESHYGNAWDKAFFFQVYDSDLLNGYDDTRINLLTRLVDVTTAIKLNNETFFGARRNWTVYNTEMMFYVNKSNSEVNPLIGASRSRGEPKGDFRLSFVGGFDSGMDTWLIHSIKIINLTDYSTFFYDAFNFNSTSNYSMSGSNADQFVRWDSANKAMEIGSKDGFLSYIQLASDPKIANAIYIFDVEYTTDVRGAGTATEMGGYMKVHTKYNGTDTDYAMIYMHSDMTSSTTPSGYGSRKSDWLNHDITQGVLSNYWGTLGGNASAYFARWSDSLPTEEAGAGYQILNIQNYYSVAAAELKRSAQIIGNTARQNYFTDILQKMTTGLLYLIESDPDWVRPDGFLQYSSSYIGAIAGKDDGYMSNSFDQLGKIQRGLGNYSIEISPLVGMSYYARYGRFNQTESTASSSFHQKNAIVAYNSKLAMYRWPCFVGFDDVMPFENMPNSVFFEEYYNDGMGFGCSNKADTFGGRTTVYYPNNSIKVNWTDAYNVYESNPTLQLRFGSQANGKVIDAYQHENTSYVEIVWAPIHNETMNCNYTFDEAYPVCGFGNTYYNRTLFRFANDADMPYYNSTIGYIDIMSPAYSPALVNINLVNANASTNYSVYVAGVNNGTLATDINGEGNLTVKATSGQLLEIRLLGGPAPAAPANWTIINWNVTNNTMYNLSNFSRHTTLNYTSSNQTTMFIRFYENGTTIYGFTLFNSTNYYINLTNLSEGINRYWWSSALAYSPNYSLIIYNGTYNFSSSPATSTDRMSGVCEKLYLSFIFVGIGVFILVVAAIIALLVSGSGLNFSTTALSILAVIITIVMGIYMLNALCQL